MAELRRIFFEFLVKDIQVPVIIQRSYPVLPEDPFRIYAATDAGGLFIDGLGDGIMLGVIDNQPKEDALRYADLSNKTAFGILQATRNRMSKTEYISCPSCGRTLFDLQETTAMIRKRTDHLKGVKIGIMGCIVNGPGEMADADYGYVGSGPGRITLYRGKDVVKRNVPSAQAVDELINLIREDGNWFQPESVDQF
jgi:(E)-4-hydroxy-3-methylbut-2-enyl-diphosphate synthase